MWVNPKKIIEIEVQKTSWGSWHVFINGICSQVFEHQYEAEEYVGGLKNLNPYHRIKRVIRGIQ